MSRLGNFLADAIAAEQKLDAIRELHQLKYDHYYRHGHFKVCSECHRPWPCPTVAILDGTPTHEPALLENWETKLRCACGAGDFATRQELTRHIEAVGTDKERGDG